MYALTAIEPPRRVGRPHRSQATQQEIRGRARKQGHVNAHERLVHRVEVEQDDVLATLQLVQGDDVLETRLYEQLVDLLVESLFLELRQSYLDGDLPREVYVDELTDLADMCRTAGLLPLPTRDA
jgi:hypothetical protein